MEADDDTEDALARELTEKLERHAERIMSHIEGVQVQIWPR